MNDYYNLLGVRPTARPEEIRAAFRRLAKGSHPDVHPNLGEAEKAEMQRRFIRLAQAYQTLTHPKRRRDYDQKLRAARMRQPPRPRGAAAAGPRASGSPPPGGKGARPAGPRPAPQREGPQREGPQRERPGTPPGGREQDLEDLLQDVDELLNKFGLNMRNQFGEMLDKMVEWALAVFLDVAQALDASGQEQPPPRPGGPPPGRSRGAGGADPAAQPPPRPPRPPPREQDLEAELEALKEQVHSAVARAEGEKATPQSVEEELERIRSGLKKDS